METGHSPPDRSPFFLIKAKTPPGLSWEGVHISSCHLMLTQMGSKFFDGLQENA
jgi:hypothetical protein